LDYPRLSWIPLSERFERLFDLAHNKSSTVAEVSSLGWEAGGGSVGVTETTVGGEEMLGECLSSFTSKSLFAGSIFR
jgi:hypothetical protein